MVFNISDGYDGSYNLFCHSGHPNREVIINEDIHEKRTYNRDSRLKAI